MKPFIYSSIAIVLCLILLSACRTSFFTSTTTVTNWSTASTLTTQKEDAYITTTVATKNEVKKTGATSAWVALTTSHPAIDEGEFLLSKKILWTKKDEIPFCAEISTKRMQGFERFFVTEKYEFYRSYMASTRFVFNNGDEYQQSELHGLIESGKVTPEQIASLFSLWIYPKEAIDTATGKSCKGKLIPFQNYREAMVLQGESSIYIYPPYDFVAKFYDDPIPSLSGDETDRGYYLNAALLQQLAESVCPERSFVAITKQEGIQVGDSLFVSKDFVEQYGICVVLQENETTPDTLHLIFPNNNP